MSSTVIRDEDFPKELNPREADDQLVAEIRKFFLENPNLEVRLLTQDVGPLMSARAHQIPFNEIPEAWLSPPETSSTDKVIKNLEHEIAILKSKEPSFKVSCLDPHGMEIKSLECDYIQLEPLTETQISELLKELQGTFPITDTNEEAPASSLAQVQSLMGKRYVPPSKHDVEKYHQKYDKWLHGCRDTISNFHILSRPSHLFPEFRYVVTNEGSRPGKDVLVEIEARGKFRIMPQSEDSDEPHIFTKLLGSHELSKPPRAPKGKWVSLFEMYGSGLGGYPPPIPNYINPDVQYVPRDPNKFYWKPEKPEEPTATFSFECEQMRHGSNPEEFRGSIFCGMSDDVSGALELRIHAENLTKAIKVILPVRLSIVRVSAYDSAKQAVEACCGGVKTTITGGQI